MHGFLESVGLINFNVEPYLKPHKLSLLKESSYSRVLVNAANKHQLSRNEDEYLANLADYDEHAEREECDEEEESGEGKREEAGVEFGRKVVETMDYIMKRKVNLLTSKERPFCGFCDEICGFSWY